MVLCGIEKLVSLFFQNVLKRVITSECQGHQILAPSIDTFSALLAIHPKFVKTHQACSPIGPLVSKVNIKEEKSSFITYEGKPCCFQKSISFNDMKNLSCLNRSNVSGGFDGSYGNLTFL